MYLYIFPTSEIIFVFLHIVNEYIFAYVAFHDFD